MLHFYWMQDPLNGSGQLRPADLICTEKNQFAPWKSDKTRNRCPERSWSFVTLATTKHKHHRQIL
jgi:hypothetical protein